MEKGQLILDSFIMLPYNYIRGDYNMTMLELHNVFNKCIDENKEKIWEKDKEIAYHSIVKRYEDNREEECDCIILTYNGILLGGLYRPDSSDIYMLMDSDWGRNKGFLYRFLSNYDIKQIWNDPDQKISVCLNGMGMKNIEEQLHDLNEILGLISLTGYKISNKEKIADHIFFEIETYTRSTLNRINEVYRELDKLECYDEIVEALKECTEKIESIQTPFKERLENLGKGQ